MAVETVTAEPLLREQDGDIALSVVTPAFNEADNLGPLVEEIVEVFDELGKYQPYEILIVDDGSDDETPATLNHLAALFDQVEGITLKRNYGQSAALAAGIDYARGNVIVTMDADRQNDPRDIPVLLDRLEDGVDCVSGWRKDRNDPLSKRVPSRIQTRLAKLTGPDIHDFGCTLKAYRSSALADIELYGEGHRYIPSKLYDKGHSVDEVEVNHRERKAGSSHYGLSRLLRGFVDLLFHWFWVRFSTRPLHFFGAVGAMSIGLGMAIGGVSLLQRYLFGVPLGPRTPRLILVALLLIAGVQILVLGAVAEMLTKLHYRDEPEYRVQEVVSG